LTTADKKEALPLTAVWQNGGFSAKINGSSSIELLCKTEHLCFDFRHFAKLQTVCDLTNQPWLIGALRQMRVGLSVTIFRNSY
jgi:hypothetical protein